MMSENVINKGPLISVIVPIYNVEIYLTNCLNSIVNQSYSNLQIILVDDGSTDRSREICDQYMKLDKRIQVVHKVNEGLVAARKSGLALARGAYIGFVDGDDYIEPLFYEHLLNELVNSSAEFVHGGFIKEDKSSRQLFTPIQKRIITSNENRILLIQNNVLNFNDEKNIWAPAIWIKLFKTDFIKKAYLKVPDNQSYGEDLLVFCRCIIECNEFIMIPNAEYHYLVRDESLSNQWNVFRFWQESNLCNELCNLWKEYNLYPSMRQHMNKYLLFRMINCMNQINNIGMGTVKYKIPNPDILQGKRLIIYGAGNVGKNYISQLLTLSQYCIVAWADRTFINKNIHYFCITKEDLKKIDFDIIIIAVKTVFMANEIKSELIDLGIKEDKLLWIKPELNLGLD